MNGDVGSNAQRNNEKEKLRREPGMLQNGQEREEKEK